MPDRFRFRLQTVLRLRKQLVDERKRDVAAAVEIVHQLERTLVRLEEEMHGIDDASRNIRADGTLDIETLRMRLLHRGWLIKQRNERLQELSTGRWRLAEHRLRLSEASTRLKVIEKLRERQWKRFQETQEKAEQVLLDELALREFSLGQLRKKATAGVLMTSYKQPSLRSAVGSDHWA